MQTYIRYLVVSMVLDDEPEDVHHQIVVCHTMDEAKTTLNKFKELGLQSLYRAGAKFEYLKLEQNDISFIIASADLERDYMMGVIKEFKIDFDDTKIMGFFLFFSKEDYDVQYVHAFLEQDKASKLIATAFLTTLELVMQEYQIDEIELVKTKMAYRILIPDFHKFYSGFCFFIPKETKENEITYKEVT